MATKETFVVRTCFPSADLGGISWVTTIAHGRPEAVRHVERIGRVREEDRPVIREFLEGKENPRGHSTFVSSVANDGACSTAIIFPVSE